MPTPAGPGVPRWLPGQETGTEEVEPPAPRYSAALARLVGFTLVIEAVVAFAYGMFAALERRGIFSALADDPSAVTEDEAGRSDLINRIAFITGGVVTAVALVLVVIWLLHARRIGAKVPLRLPWLAVTVLAVVGIAYALALHTSDDVEQITYGYLIFAIAALLTAAAAVIGLVVLRRVDAQLTPAPDDAEPNPAPAWPVPHP